jgi:hypothetical protein
MNGHPSVKVRCSACDGRRVGHITRHRSGCGCGTPPGEPAWWVQYNPELLPFWPGPTRGDRFGPEAKPDRQLHALCRAHGDLTFTARDAVAALAARKDLRV